MSCIISYLIPDPFQICGVWSPKTASYKAITGFDVKIVSTSPCPGGTPVATAPISLIRRFFFGKTCIAVNAMQTFLPTGRFNPVFPAQLFQYSISKAFQISQLLKIAILMAMKPVAVIVLLYQFQKFQRRGRNNRIGCFFHILLIK